MDFVKQYPIFTGIVALCLLVFVGEIYFVFSSITAAEEAQSSYETVYKKRSEVILLSPKPSTKSLTASEENIEELKTILNERIVKIRGNNGEDIGAGHPEDSNDMFFEIKNFIENFQRDANRLVEDEWTQDARPYIEVEEDFTFGFGYFMRMGKGPLPENIKDVYIQRRVLNFLLRKLFDAEPKSILAVERNPVAANTSEDSIGITQASKDLFLIDPLVSAQVPGAIDTLSFRIKFTGFTKSLRLFLNSISEFDWPLVVRSVEVKPFAETKSRPVIIRNNSGGGLFAEQSRMMIEDPIVSDNISTFVVIIEFIELQADAFSVEDSSVEAPNNPGKQ